MEQKLITLHMPRGAYKDEEVLDPEALLVARAQEGSEEAFGKLVEIYQAKILNFILTRVGQRETAEDITQEVLVKAFFNLSGLKDVRKFRSWIFKIASNLLKDTVRKLKLEIVDTEESLKEAYVEKGTPEISTHREVRAKMIKMALSRLKPEQRQALILCDIEGLSYKEIAEIMRIPLGTVQSRIFYARKKLQEILIKDFGYRGEDQNEV